MQKVKSLITKPSKDPSNYLYSAILEIQSTRIKFCKYKSQGTNCKDLKKTTIERNRDEHGCYSYHTVA